ncbi:hypothetical protein EYR38_008059 [Pleurotus pulmonarius]|nr:hypothetical protein EYR38_008059 [Pleurotus pulmonarius]
METLVSSKGYDGGNDRFNEYFAGKLSVPSARGECSPSNHGQAYAYFPIAWSTGATLGPMIGGSFSHPVERFPALFGASEFLKSHPYFLPCAVPATFAIVAWLVTFFLLKETVASPTPISHILPFRKQSQAAHDVKKGLLISENNAETEPEPEKPTLGSVLTRRVVIASANYACLSLVDIAFRAIQPLFYSTPVEMGGLGLPPQIIGNILSLFGILNGVIQVFCFAYINDRWGSKRVFLVGLASAILLFLSFPLLNILARSRGTSILVWAVVGMQVTISVFTSMSYGAIFIYISASAPSRSLLGATNGLAQTTVSIMRAIGPAAANSLFSLSIEKQYLGGWMGFIRLSHFASLRTMAAAKFSPEDSALISSLIALAEKSPKLVKWSDYPAPGDPSITVRSWKMNEFKYYDIPSPFPTLARGLYSQKLADGDSGEERHRIVARGYDKFFNIGEVPWTTWPSLEAHTAAPYTLTLKSNGCIIFIAALTPTKVVVTSKHSLGPVVGAQCSHAQMGERWLRKYLDEKGRTEEEFAKVLWEKNWTAILELCDDSFEEHVLPYPPHLTGLHLHGLNKASAGFDTEGQAEVDAFAAEWGFIRTQSIVLPTISAVREFTAEVGQTGKWEGEAVEGFVVRCRVSNLPAESPKGDARDKPAHNPYPSGSSFFFKIKFDEPYLMYRDWREITKILITTLTKSTKNKPGLSFGSSTKDILATLPKTKMKRPETQKYAAWVCEELKQEMRENHGELGPKFETYTKGKGIIATRQRFLEVLEANSGTLGDVDNSKSDERTEGSKTFGKTVIVPIAIPGCGKTAVSVALAHIFGFGHTQSDDIKAKKSAPVFIRNVQNLLEIHNIVIADKNNHLSQHRAALREATASLSPPVRLLALNWNHVLFPTPTSSNPNPLSLPAIHRLASNRILSRGANHQSLLADETASRAHEDVVWMFIQKAEDLTEGECDAVVDMDLQESLEESVERAVNALCKELGLDLPSKELVKEGVDKAKGYVPAKKAEEGKEKGKEKKKKEVRYFAILPEVDLSSVIEKRLEGESPNKFWEELKAKERVAKRPHITITHNRSLPAEQDIWDACKRVDTLGIQETPLFWVRFSDLLWDGRVMALVVDDFGVHEGGAEAKSFRESLPDEVRKRLHVTVGTLGDDVPPVEAMGLVKAWRRGDSKSTGPGNGDIQHLSLVDGSGESQGWVVGRLRGAFH